MNFKEGVSGNPRMDTYHVSVAMDTPCYSGELFSNSVFCCQHKASNGATFLALNCPLFYEIMFSGVGRFFPNNLTWHNKKSPTLCFPNCLENLLVHEI